MEKVGRVDVPVGDRRGSEFRVEARVVAGITLIVPELLGYVIRVERSQYPLADIVFRVTR